MSNVLPVFLLFFYIYPISFFGFPLTTRLIFGFFSLVIFVGVIYKRRFTLNKAVIPIFLILISMLMVSLLTIYFNGTNDFEFVKYPLSVFAILLSAYTVIKIFLYCNVDLELSNILDLFVKVVLLQSILALLMSIFPYIYKLCIVIQGVGFADIARISEYNGSRIIGFGSMFFGAGVIHGLALIFLMYNYRVGFYNYKKLKAIFIFIFIFIIGVGMARTTFIGFSLSLLFLIIPTGFKFSLKKDSCTRNILFFSILFLVPLIILFFIYFAFPSLLLKIKPFFDFAFEMFINYAENGSFSSNSTDHLSTMYIYPQEIHTYLIGDGIYINNDGSYYMHTDVGFLRLIYYFGIPGLFLYMFFQYYTISSSIILKQGERTLIFIVFLYLLLLNLKGFTDLVSVFALLLLSAIIKPQRAS